MIRTLSNEEQRLLHYLQAGIPVISRPFEHIGRDMHMQEDRVLDSLYQWKENGMIRWFGAIFSTVSLGYQSTLAALSVPYDKIVEAADIINQHPGVTHNYQRDYDYNLWFTLAVPPEENIEAHLGKLARAGGAQKWLHLPVIKTYKIKLILPLGENKIQMKSSGVLSSDRIYSLTEEEKALVRILQEDWPIVSTPYAHLAKQWGKNEKCLIEKVKQWKTLDIIRRIAAILRHREVGFTINWMVAWQIEEKKIDSAGRHAALSPLVSHCYQRQITKDWVYPLFTMVHARSKEEAQKTIEGLRQSLDPEDYIILPTIREFKKTRLRLFV